MIANDTHVVLAQLERFVQDCERLELLVVHFSGHGFRWNGQLYLLCNNTNIENKLFNATAINILQIKNILEGCKAKHKLLILDCCYAGSAWKGEGQLPELEILKGSVNITIAACSPLTLTQELDSLELYGKKGASFLSWTIARACDEQFAQVAQEKTLSLQDILDWLPNQRNSINQILPPEKHIPAPRILNERDLVGDDEIWFTSRRRRTSREDIHTEEKQREEHALLSQIPFLQRPCSNAKFEHFDIERLKAFAQHDQDADSLPVEHLPSLCQDLGLTSTIGTPINAAVLAFHKSPTRCIAAAMIRATAYIADEHDRYFKEDIEGPLGKQVERALHWLLTNLRTISEHVDAGQRIDRCEIPEQALRELIANAVVHRDYEATPT
jgi:hypothetical protein